MHSASINQIKTNKQIRFIPLIIKNRVRISRADFIVFRALGQYLSQTHSLIYLTDISKVKFRFFRSFFTLKLFLPSLDDCIHF